MNKLARCICCLLVISIALPALADNSQKARKLLSKVTAMSADPSGRRAVSLALSETISVRRSDLARLRHLMNISYGDLFLAFQLTKNGVNLDQIGAQMKIGKTVWQIADEHNPDWKQIATDAKKINGRIDESLLQHFSNSKYDALHNADGYDPFLDSVVADKAISREEMTEAQQRYAFLHDHAGVVAGGRLDTSDEKAVSTVRPDPVRDVVK